MQEQPRSLTRRRVSAVTVANQTYTEDVGIIPLALPEASGGNGTLSYSLTPTVPGLAFDRGHTHAERHADPLPAATT